MKRLLILLVLASCASKEVEPVQPEPIPVVKNEYCLRAKDDNGQLQFIVKNKDVVTVPMIPESEEDSCLFIHPVKLDTMYFTNSCGKNVDYHKFVIDKEDWTDYVASYPDLKEAFNVSMEGNSNIQVLYRIYAVKITQTEKKFFIKNHSNKRYSYEKEKVLNRFVSRFIDTFDLTTKWCE